MINDHLTEKEIQQFIFEKDACSTKTIDHISGCEICRVRASNYKLIGDNLKLVGKPSFNYDLSSMILKQISTGRPRSKFGVNLLLSFLFVFASVLIIGSAGYAIINVLDMNELTAALPGSFTMIAGICGVVLSSFYIADIILHHRKLIKLIDAL